MCKFIFTARIRSTTGRLCFDMCLSIHLSVQRGGGGVRSSCRGGVSGPAAGGGGGCQVQLPGGGSGPAGGGGGQQR